MDNYRIKPGTKVDLKKVNPDDTGDYQKDKKDEQTVAKLLQDLDQLQELLYAERKHKVLVVLQAMDTAGKDGTISHVFEGVNPEGVRVASFKVPTQEERDHDFLWRIHKETPGNGEIVIFNRSHYEDVLIVRVHQLISKEVWERRYTEINHFEHMLADEGTTMLKFFLHISQDEQKKRLQQRLDDKDKNWKFSTADLAERKLWPDYMKAYEDTLSATSTPWAPWYVVPANKKWFRNLVVATTLVDALKGLDMHYPAPANDLDKVVIN
jgi:PPK2 family polyphosphate:nucleotide phosphotransferase